MPRVGAVGLGWQSGHGRVEHTSSSLFCSQIIRREDRPELDSEMLLH